MSRTYEIASFDTRMPLRCEMHEIGRIAEHRHDFFEIDMVLSGRCTVTIDDVSYRLKAEDVISIESHAPHALVGADCVFLSVQFEQTMFEKTLPNPQHPEFFCNSAVQGDGPAFHSVRTLLARLVKNNADRQTGYELHNWSLIYELMDVFYNSFRVMSSGAQDALNHRYAERVNEIARIIREEHTENLTLTALAQKVHLSAPYLSKFFEQQFGVTYLRYLTEVRLQHAMGLLLNTDDSIETVSAESGFPNSHSFVQAFKKEFGTLPSVYRRRNRMEPPAPDTRLPDVKQNEYMAGLKKYLSPSDDRGPDPTPGSVIRCSALLRAGESGRMLRHTWREVTGVSTASDLLIADVQAMLRRTQEEIGFRYVKFNGIFNDDMHLCSRTEDGLLFSFTYADKVFDFLRSVQLRPFLSLSFMPSALARDPERRLLGFPVSEPVCLNEWAEMVRALLTHVLRRYGADEVRQWRFSVWHLPDSGEDLFGFRDMKRFCDFYEATWKTVKECDPLLQIGTPPTYYITEKDQPLWYLSFLEECARRGCTPDFLNFVYYDTVQVKDGTRGQETFGFVGSMTLQDTPDGFREFVDQVRAERTQLMAAGSDAAVDAPKGRLSSSLTMGESTSEQRKPEAPASGTRVIRSVIEGTVHRGTVRNDIGRGKRTDSNGDIALPIYLTEWNHTPSQQDLLGDTCYQSCYLVKSILENYDRLESFGHWSLTDLMGEAPLPKDLFFGGVGIFTADGLPKAGYYAFTLLRQLGDVFLGQGEGWFATRQDGCLRILLYNYRHFSHLYSLGERFDMTFTDRYTPFDPVRSMDVHVTIQDAADGDYLVRETSVSRSSGSAFDQWLQMGAIDPDTPEERRSLEALSVPRRSKYVAAAEDGVLELDAMLDMLEVRLVEVEKM